MNVFMINEIMKISFYLKIWWRNLLFAHFKHIFAKFLIICSQIVSWYRWSGPMIIYCLVPIHISEMLWCLSLKNAYVTSAIRQNDWVPTKCATLCTPWTLHLTCIKRQVVLCQICVLLKPYYLESVVFMDIL